MASKLAESLQNVLRHLPSSTQDAIDAISAATSTTTDEVLLRYIQQGLETDAIQALPDAEIVVRHKDSNGGVIRESVIPKHRFTRTD
jgi:hypothetical protein